MMATRYDMPTNEGSLALARAIATGSKLVVRGAALCNVASGMDTVADVASLTWGDISSSSVNGVVMPCTSYLPSMVDYAGNETGSPMAALDLEFAYFPTSEISYNVVAVLADMYYAIAPFKMGSGYNAGDVVWVSDASGNYTYYRCILKSDGSTYPSLDGEHWSSVTIVDTLDGTYGNLQYSTITSDPILLYVSKASGVITISPQMELDYKVRLFLDGVKNTSSINDFVVFDTLGTEFMASAQLGLLAEFSRQLRAVRDVALAKASRS